MMAAPNSPAAQWVEPEQSPWGLSLQPAGCPLCKRVFLVQADHLGRVCPSCFQSKLEAQPAWLRSEPPERVVQFRKGRNDLHQILASFTQGVWLHADDFTPESLFQHVRPVYFPMWLVDSNVAGDWQGEAGFDYQVKSSQESYHEGRWISQDVVETRIRWEPRLGQLMRHYDNITVPALSDHQALMENLGNFQFDQCTPYQPGLIGTADMLVPDLQPEHAWPTAAASLERAAAEECRQAAGAEHLRQYALTPDYSGLNWTQLLLPLYISYYTRDDGQPQPVWVNGQTGVVGGLRLASQKKGWQLAAILEGLALALVGMGLLAAIIPPITLLGILMVLAGFALAIIGVVPAVWPWQWNRGQQPRKVISR